MCDKISSLNELKENFTLSSEIRGKSISLHCVSEVLNWKEFSTCEFLNMTFRATTFIDVNFGACDFKNVSFENCVFVRCEYRFCNITECTFENSRFVDSVIRESQLDTCGLLCEDFDRCYISNASVMRSILFKCVFSRSQLYAMKFEKILSHTNHFIETAIQDVTGELHVPMACPEKGSFIGYKKAHDPVDGSVIVELKIPASAKRSSATSNKCRCDKSKGNIYNTIRRFSKLF